MFKTIRLIKRYYGLANIKKSLLFFQFVLLLFPALMSIITPLLAANVITALTVFDFSKAISILTLDFIIIAGSAIFYFLYHILSRKINRILYTNFHEYLYSNIKKNKNIKSINLPTITNVATCIEFNKTLLYKFCFFIKSIITLVIIFYFNNIFCFVIVFVSIISYLLLSVTDKKIQQKTKELSQTQQQSLDLFNSIHKGGSIEENYNLNVILKNKYFSQVETQIKTSNQISLYFSINKNFISLILKTTIFVMTILLITQIKTTMLTLSLYLILTPYLTSSAQNLISFFEIFSEFGNIENILDEFSSLEYSESEKTSEKIEINNFNLYIYHLGVKSQNSHLKDINLNAVFGKSIFIEFLNKNDLTSLTKLLERKVKPDFGTIFFDNKNISDIAIEEYRKYLVTTNINPTFFNVSLSENLLMVCPSKKQIKKAIKDFKLSSFIETSHEKENTLINESINQEFLFLLGVLRCYLSGAKIICIESYPDFKDDELKKIFLHILKFMQGKRTLILLNYKNNLKVKTDEHYVLEKGKLKEF